MLQHRYWMPVGILVSFGLPTLVGAMMGDAWGGFLFGGVIRCPTDLNLKGTVGWHDCPNSKKIRLGIPSSCLLFIEIVPKLQKLSWDKSIKRPIT